MVALGNGRFKPVRVRPGIETGGQVKIPTASSRVTRSSSPRGPDRLGKQPAGELPPHDCALGEAVEVSIGWRGLPWSYRSSIARLIRWSTVNRPLVLLVTLRRRLGYLRCATRRSTRSRTCPTCRSSSRTSFAGQRRKSWRTR